MTETRRVLLAWIALGFVTPICASVADDRDRANASTSSRETMGERLDYSPPAWPESPDTGALLLRLAAGTVTVLALCVVTLLASRRWLRGPMTKPGGGSELQVIDSVALGNRCWVHLLRAGRHQVVIGTDSSGLKSLVTLPESFEKSLAEVESSEAAYSGSASEQPIEAGLGSRGRDV